MKNSLKTISEKKRFQSKIGFTLACWHWDGAKNNAGYGVFKLRGKSELAHRISFSNYNGKDIASGMVIDHICKNRNCVNPFHLREVTQAENLINSDSASSVNRRRIDCKSGHKFDTTYRGKRYCSICARKRASIHTKNKRMEIKNAR